MTSQCGRAGNEATNEASSAVFDIPAIRSKPTGEKQYDEDDQDNTDDADAAVSISLTLHENVYNEASCSTARQRQWFLREVVI
jgi:hypothetical protein